MNDQPLPDTQLAAHTILSPRALLPTNPTMRPLCSWPLDTEEGIIRLHGVISGVTKTLWDDCLKGPITIAVTDLAAHFTEFEQPDNPGELIQGPMLSLLGPDGVYHSESQWVYVSLQQLSLVIGPPPWLPPVLLTVDRVETRKKRIRMAVTYAGRRLPGSDN